MKLTTRQLLEHLQADGFTCSEAYLGYALRARPVLRPAEKVGSLFVWSEADILRLKAFLHERDRGPHRKNDLNPKA